MTKSSRLFNASSERDRSFARQWSWLVALSFAFVAYRLWNGGTNIVTETYRLGTLRFFMGDDPYRLPLVGGDRYEYSPFFCLFYGIFAYLPSSTQALSWALFNASLFWAGALSWVRLDRGEWVRLGIPFVLCAMELNISLLYQQINAAIIGLSLLGLACVREQRYFLGAICLTIATNVKLMPVAFLAPLVFYLPKRFWWGAVTSGLFVLLIPAAVRGWAGNFSLHRAWVERVATTMELVRPGQLDVASTLTTLGYPKWGTFLLVFIFISGAGTLLFSALKRAIDWPYWISLAAITLLLISPRSESPTFVFLAPSYLLLAAAVAQNRITFSWLVVVTGAILTSLVYTDVWPKGALPELRQEFLSKPLGALFLWTIALGGTLAGALRQFTADLYIGSPRGQSAR